MKDYREGLNDLMDALCTAVDRLEVNECTCGRRVLFELLRYMWTEYDRLRAAE